MLRYLLYLIFILSVALAAGGILLATRLRNRYKHNVFSSLLYFQAFIFTFGFYGIWGQVVIKAFLSSYISADLLSRLSDMGMLLGLPFLIFAWLMLIRFSSGISGRQDNNWFIFWFLLINFSIIISLGYYISKNTSVQPVSLIRYYFIFMSLLYSVVVSMLIFFPLKGRSFINNYDRNRIAPVLFIVMVSQCVPLFFYGSQTYVGIIFIFTFFAGNIYLPVYLNYGTLLRGFHDETKKDLSFEDFCKKFEVSPRETDIVREICNGLSNKEISEKLFISLQTVKDHTHRIYIKTNVRSRVQLMNLVKEIIGR
jgi:DNA-binding CsgD family transcriptional regulator